MPRSWSTSAHCVRLASLAAVLTLSLAPNVQAGPRWMLVYYRQIGNHVNGGAFTVENHLFREDGTKGAGIGVTNQFNLGFPVWGQTNADGWNRIDPDTSAYRDVRIYQPPVPTDQTPNFYHYNPNHAFGRYSFETHWMYVNDDALVTAYPTMPVYHYDLVAGINNSQYVEPPGAESDAFSLALWTQPVYQTFVVPQGINRIVSCKSWTVAQRQHRTVCSIHQDNGGALASWPQVGPAKTSRLHHDSEFMPVVTNWALQDVPVTPGQRYALKIRPEDNQGFNVYATSNDNYPGGSMTLNDFAVPHRDLCAVVVGVRYGTIEQPTIARNPVSFTRQINIGESLADDTFTVRNSGTGTLTYAVTDNASWLSVNPSNGTSSGETDTLTIDYLTAGLGEGLHNATVTITATGATNTPQTIAVNLTVLSPFAPVDHDEDGDVDMEDFGWFQRCYTGSGIAQTDPGCAKARLDDDDDVDLGDFGRFQLCLTGANRPAEPDCAD